MHRLATATSLFIMAILGGCANAQSSAISVGSGSGVYLFSGVRSNIKIDLINNKVNIDGFASALNNCSDDKYFCYNSKDVGLLFIAPKQCDIAQSNTWLYNNIEMFTVSMVPESDEASMIVSGSPKFMFGYSPSGGIVKIYVDPQGKLFGEDHLWSRLGYEDLKAYEYLAPTGQNAFKCNIKMH